MRTLSFLDYAIIAVYILLCFVIGFYFTKRASKSVDHFFIGGRSMPWWLLGVSMAATNFAPDTPLAITKYIFQEGIAGCWFFWAMAIQSMLTCFLFAQLWRRSEMVTDAEIVEKRYGGKAGAFLRLFKGFYFGVLINCVIMGWVFKALIKTMTGLTTLDPTTVIVVFTTILILYTMFAGIYAALWTDLFQYFVELAGVVTLTWFTLKSAGGIGNVLTQLNTMYGESSGITNFYPSWPQATQWMPFSVFMTYIGMQWWANKFADGGGKHIQRMLSAKNEMHSMLAVFFFSFMNYVVRIWPWILIALASLIVFGREMKDPEMAYPMMIGRVLPSGMLGLMLIAIISSFMTVTSTHVNLGSSYMVNDIYRRFLVKNASDKHYVLVSRFATLLTLLIAIGVAMKIDSIGNTWKLVIEFASGAGATWILRWFWWRINAWSEISAMLTSGIVTTYIELTHKVMIYSHKMWWIVGISTFAWITATFLTKPADEKVLKAFVEKVRPAALGWQPIYKKYGNLKSDFKLGGALFSVIVGLIFLFTLNFGLGNVLLLNTTTGLWQLGIAAGTFVFLLYRIQKQTSPKIIPAPDMRIPAEETV